MQATITDLENKVKIKEIDRDNLKKQLAVLHEKEEEYEKLMEQ